MASTVTELMMRRMGAKSGSAVDWETLYKAALDSQFASGQLIIPYGIRAIRGSQFAGCSGFVGDLVIPSTVRSLGTYSFDGCSGITSIIIEGAVARISARCFAGCNGVTLADLPSAVTQVDSYGLRFPSCKTFICRAVIPPSLTSGSLQVSNTCSIYVPDASVNDYKAANIWSNYASRIFPISDLTT